MTSRTVSAVPQVDGRVSVEQAHVRDDGTVVQVFVLAEPGTDLDALLAVYAAQMEAGA